MLPLNVNALISYRSAHFVHWDEIAKFIRFMEIYIQSRHSYRLCGLILRGPVMEMNGKTCRSKIEFSPNSPQLLIHFIYIDIQSNQTLSFIFDFVSLGATNFHQ